MPHDKTPAMVRFAVPFEGFDETDHGKAVVGYLRDGLAARGVEAQSGPLVYNALDDAGISTREYLKNYAEMYANAAALEMSNPFGRIAFVEVDWKTDNDIADFIVVEAPAPVAAALYEYVDKDALRQAAESETERVHPDDEDDDLTYGNYTLATADIGAWGPAEDWDFDQLSVLFETAVEQSWGKGRKAFGNRDVSNAYGDKTYEEAFGCVAQAIVRQLIEDRLNRENDTAPRAPDPPEPEFGG